jgi:hypothetical protein
MVDYEKTGLVGVEAVTGHRIKDETGSRNGEVMKFRDIHCLTSFV